VEALFAPNALQDADKHRSFAVLVSGISYPEVRVFWDNEGLAITTPTYVAPGEELVKSRRPDSVRPSRGRGPWHSARRSQCKSMR
jgi:hypothetical protein